MTASLQGQIRAIDAPASILGESPLWHPTEQVLYWCDIPGHALNRFDPASGQHKRWQFDTDLACIAPMADGGLVMGMRDGLWRFDLATGERRALASPPYDASKERFNDGKCDPQGRFWTGTIYEPRDPPLASLHRFSGGQLTRMADGIVTCNGLGWSLDARTMYVSDTKAHTIYAYDFAAADGSIANRRVFASFPVKQADQDLSTYGGRPDGAAIDAEGCYWAAMFEGQRLVRLSPTGELLSELRLPVRCPTMPCFGGPDLKTLYITTSQEKRPAAELAEQPLAGHVLAVDVVVAGLPANVFR